MENFIGRQKQVYPVGDADMEMLIRNMEEIQCRKGEQISCEGRRDKNVYFVKEGLTRAYVVRNGKEVTLWFAEAGEILVLTSQEISYVNIEVMENSVLLRISRNTLDSLFCQSLGLANWGRCLLEKYIMEYEHYFIDYSWVSAQDQYEKLMEKHPDLLQKVSLKCIASYLQITPQSLSRIRSKIK